MIVLMEQPQYQQILQRVQLTRKPFTCPTCMCLWSNLLMLLLTEPFTWEIPIGALAAAYLGTFLHRQINTF
jgi:hypothetical protein